MHTSMQALKHPLAVRAPTRSVAPFPAVPAVRIPARLGRSPAIAGAAAAAGTGTAAKQTAGGEPKTPHWQLVSNELAKTEGKKMVVVSVAPAVRVSISESFGLPPGTIQPGQLVAGLHKLGFDRVFDMMLTADLTIMEEGAELLHRLTKHLEGRSSPEEALPMFTSCCPGWVMLVEKTYPELIPYLSTCKSPQMMMGAVVKNYFASEAGLKPSDIMSCAFVPCVRKQGEADRPMMTTTSEGPDVEHVITTLDVGLMLHERGIDLQSLPEEEFDCPLGIGSGGGQLFGTTGGVMEAALRIVVEMVSGKPMERVVYEEVRGLEGIKAATLSVQPAPNSPFAKFNKDGKGIDIRVAVANGLGNAKKLIHEVQAGTSKYDFVEVMACPGGCIGGGGQPRSSDKQILQKRQQAVYSLDQRNLLRRASDNPVIAKLYKDWLLEPDSQKAHEMLHTFYVPGGPDGRP